MTAETTPTSQQELATWFGRDHRPWGSLGSPGDKGVIPLPPFTQTSGSWLNFVEVGFAIIEKQGIHRGSFASVGDLNAKSRVFIDGWNDRCHPFV